MPRSSVSSSWMIRGTWNSMSDVLVAMSPFFFRAFYFE